jgi:hypothetical protein
MRPDGATSSSPASTTSIARFASAARDSSFAPELRTPRFADSWTETGAHAVVAEAT